MMNLMQKYDEKAKKVIEELETQLSSRSLETETAQTERIQQKDEFLQ